MRILLTGRLPLWAVFAVIGILILFIFMLLIVVDRRGIFGIEQELLHELLVVRFSVRDNASGAPIAGVRARCTRKGTENACSTRKVNRMGELIVNIPVQYYQSRSRLFSHSIGKTFADSSDTDIHIFFIHNDYYHKNETWALSALYATATERKKILLQQRSTPATMGDDEQ